MAAAWLWCRYKIQMSWLTGLGQVLLEGGADPEYGTPSAIQCLAMFKQEGKWAKKFEAAPGRGKAKAVPQDESEERAPETFKA
ncbi:ankyrin-like protein [Colletotrichum tofieldiae]|nr:ankyrin-like protein [Colletotrichum tofieldiae]GKT70668.1 ankyrin-like protein [Colletotrichum tofieldiae]GKT94440.1 ankyrin-like protein [Colletotrichum tofieldiae]